MFTFANACNEDIARLGAIQMAIHKNDITNVIKEHCIICVNQRQSMSRLMLNAFYPHAVRFFCTN